MVTGHMPSEKGGTWEQGMIVERGNFTLPLLAPPLFPKNSEYVEHHLVPFSSLFDNWIGLQFNLISLIRVERGGFHEIQFIQGCERVPRRGYCAMVELNYNGIKSRNVNRK